MKEMTISLRNVGHINPKCMSDYIERGGYKGLKKARQMDQVQLIEMIEKSGGLRGRGGAGFNTGFKWSSAHGIQSDEKYIVCNADEGEPGTYKDRTILEGDPHTVIEGMLIAAYAVGASGCYIYCRSEYQEAIDLLKNACKQVTESGLSHGIDLKVMTGAGAYVCGEETALLNSMEGKRGEPRLKPPFPTISGYKSKPTVVNNVETFAIIPMIVEKGGDWFKSIGAPNYPGTKIFSLSGDVVNKGCVEVTTDTSLEDIIYTFGGGIKEGRSLKAIQLGGSSCPFISPDHIKTKVDFESVRNIGGALGSGALLLIDDSHNMVDVLMPIAEFFHHESCGKCIPCREGNLRVKELLAKIQLGQGNQEDLEQLKALANHMNQSCFCALGQSSTSALMSAIDLFPLDFEEKLNHKEVD
jgi:NADH-quinone oxidoreductase subunit F